MKKAKSNLLKNKNYVKLLCAVAVTRFGDSLDSIALSWLAYKLTGSTLIMGMIFAISFIPNIILLPFAGVMADLGNRKTFILIGDIGRCASVCLMAGMLFFDVLQVWHLFVFVVINSIFESIASPSRGTLSKMILEEDEYISGSSYLQSASTFGSLIGLSAAGVIIAAFGVWTAVLLDGITFLASAAFISAMNLKETGSWENLKKVKIPAFFNQMKEGITFIAKSPIHRSIVWLAAFMNISLVPLNVLRPVYVDVVLNAGAEGLGWIGSGMLVGMILGGLAAGKYAKRYNPALVIAVSFTLVSLSASLLGLPGLVEFSRIPPIYFAVFVTFVLGFFFPFAMSTLSGLVLGYTQSEKMGRVSSILNILSLSSVPIGGALCGWLAESISVPAIFAITGVFGLFMAIQFGITNSQRVQKAIPATGDA